jgi:hypothetical protein
MGNVPASLERASGKQNSGVIKTQARFQPVFLI